MIVKETSSMMYKSLNDLAPQYISDLFVRLSDFHTREVRNTINDLAVPLNANSKWPKVSSQWQILLPWYKNLEQV